MLGYFILVILSVILAGMIYILLQSYLNRRKFKAKYHTIMAHLMGLDFPQLQLCNIYACAEELIFVAAKQEVRIDRSRIHRLGVYSELDFKRKAESEKVETGALEGMIPSIPHKNNQDVYILVINYFDRSGNIAVAGLVNDVLGPAIERFVSLVNEYYGLQVEVINSGSPGSSTVTETESFREAADEPTVPDSELEANLAPNAAESD